MATFSHTPYALPLHFILTLILSYQFFISWGRIPKAEVISNTVLPLQHSLSSIQVSFYNWATFKIASNDPIPGIHAFVSYFSFEHCLNLFTSNGLNISLGHGNLMLPNSSVISLLMLPVLSVLSIILGSFLVKKLRILTMSQDKDEALESFQRTVQIVSGNGNRYVRPYVLRILAYMNHFLKLFL